jgi:hypothetical protein
VARASWVWRASANGDQHSFSELYERHANAKAEDLTAVVFLETFRRLKGRVTRKDGCPSPNVE